MARHLLLALLLVPVLVSSAWADPPCEVCVQVPDTCCSIRPPLQQAEAPAFSPQVMVGTREPSPGWPYCVTVFDLGSPPPSPLEDTNWAAILRYNGPFNTWNADSLGSVFGLTLDEYGNIFVTHTSCYNLDLIGQVFNGGPGAVYRIDGNTGVITTFCRLPNYPDPSVTAGDNLPGLGNISYDCVHKQFFVTNLEDGRIYRIKPVGVNGATGTVVQAFDPLIADLGPTVYTQTTTTPGWAPFGERLWGVQWHGSRVFYGVWNQDFSGGTSPNAVRSVALDGLGAILPGTDQHELFLPNISFHTWSMPVSDISFSATGKMLLGERGIQGQTFAFPHVARALEFACVAGCWAPAAPCSVGIYGNQENCAGGVDYDRSPYTGGVLGRTWASGDAIHLGSPYPDAIYGYQGFRPTGGTVTTSLLIDSDGMVVSSADKMYIGDIETPGCGASPGSICGQKYSDLDHDGVHDAGEPALSGWSIVLIGPGGPITATTDVFGNYCFNDVAPGNYTVQEAGQPGWVQTAPVGGIYTLAGYAGTAVGGLDFGNFACGARGPCVAVPPGMQGWWPFNELPGSTTAKDVLHLSPSKNVAQLAGGAAIITGGEVGNAICFPGEFDLAQIPYANQVGLNFAAQSFSGDGWVKPQNISSTGRILVEKRRLISSGPYKTQGWAVYLNAMQLFLEIGTGVNTQVVPGPSLAPVTWNHFAFSVDRATSQGRWYLNGAVAPAFNFVPIPGNVSSTADVYFGNASPPFGVGALQGCLDEIELFNAVIAPATVANLYAAGSVGKCAEYCRVPEVTTICKNATSVTVCFNICNNTATAQSYHWSLAGLPAGAGCSVNGPVVFNPPAGSITVAAGTCSPPICVTIPRPAGLTAQNATACYQLTLFNDATGACKTCIGTIRADNTCWCITPLARNIVTVAARVAPTGISIGIGHPCDTAALPWRVVPVYWTGDHPDPLAVSLNGLPPGEPATGTYIANPGVNGTVTVDVRYPNGDNPTALYELVFEADTDGDGLYERICGTRIRSEADSTVVTDAPGAPTRDALRLVATPNPFRGGSTIAFTLGAADDVSLAVFDLSGRMVRRLQSGRLPAGAHRIAWDGKDAQGREAATGVYFVKLRSERLRLESKLLKLR